MQWNLTKPRTKVVKKTTIKIPRTFQEYCEKYNIDMPRRYLKELILTKNLKEIQILTGLRPDRVKAAFDQVGLKNLYYNLFKKKTQLQKF